MLLVEEEEKERSGGRRRRFVKLDFLRVVRIFVTLIHVFSVRPRLSGEVTRLSLSELRFKSCCHGYDTHNFILVGLPA